MTDLRIRRRTRGSADSNIVAADTPRPESPADLAPDLKVETRPIETLTPYANNARRHSDRQIGKVAQSIRTFGFVNPILVDAEGGVVAGHGRLAAAARLGMTEVPTIRLDHLGEAERRAYVLADNRLAELSDWDRDMLAIELGALAEFDLDGTLDFDISVTGFETAEIDLLLDGPSETATSDLADALPEDAEGPAVTRPGDLWVLGDHRILCGDALSPENLETVMAGETARVVFTDPPYNVPIDGHVCGLGAVKHREFAMGVGEMSSKEFAGFLRRTLEGLADVCVDGALLYVCMDWRHLRELLEAAAEAGLALINLCVWNKSNGGMGSLYRSKHEMICVFKRGEAAHVNNVELGRHGRYRTNVWDYAGVNSFGRDRLDDLAAHPTVKPTALVADAIKDASKRGEIALDVFGGSGTTLLAAERTRRRARLIELDPAYVDVAVRRWQALTGRQAMHAETGETFDERAAAAARTGEAGHVPA